MYLALQNVSLRGKLCKAEIEQALKACDTMDARWSNNSPEKKIENQVIRTPSNDEVSNERKVLKLKNERQNTTSRSKYYKQDETPRSFPSMKPNLTRWGGLSNQEVFTLVHQQVELVGAIRLRLIRTNRSASC